MKGQIALLDDKEIETRQPSWKIDDRTRRIGLRQVEIARRVLLEGTNQRDTQRQTQTRGPKR